MSTSTQLRFSCKAVCNTNTDLKGSIALSVFKFANPVGCWCVFIHHELCEPMGLGTTRFLGWGDEERVLKWRSFQPWMLIVIMDFSEKGYSIQHYKIYLIVIFIFYGKGIFFFWRMDQPVGNRTSRDLEIRSAKMVSVFLPIVRHRYTSIELNTLQWSYTNWSFLGHEPIRAMTALHYLRFCFYQVLGTWRWPQSVIVRWKRCK